MQKKSLIKNKNGAYSIIISFAALVLLFYSVFLRLTSSEEKTDNAQIDANVVPIAARVSGQITKLYVQDHEFVKKGAILAEIDSHDYIVRELQAEADLEAAKLNAKIKGTTSQTSGILFEQQKVDLARIKAAEALLVQTQMQVQYTKIFAPEDGTLSRLAVSQGQLIEVGQILGQLVEDNPYVIANFKETQIRKMKPGQNVLVTLDAYPGQSLSGKVQRVAGATGARFSLLAPDNASGNFVKVVQRIPVRIDLDLAKSTVSELKAGLSAEVTVFLD